MFTSVDLLVAGGIIFWLVLAVWLIALFAFVKTEYSVPAILCTVVYFVALQFFFRVDLLDAAFHHPMKIIIGVIGYFVLGTAWSFFRWFVFVKEKINEFIDMRDKWLMEKGQTQFKCVPDELKEEWAKYIEDGARYSANPRKDLCKPPLVRMNKSKIMAWIGFWPVSVCLWVFEDMIKGIARSIYGYIHDWLQDMANTMFSRNIAKDLPENFK